MSVSVVNRGSGENITTEVTAQIPLIENIMEGLVGKVQGATATADKILEGYSAYVGQTLVNGTYVPGVPIEAFGLTKYAVDKFTYKTRVRADATWIDHTLGEIPKLAFIIPDDSISNTKTNNDLYFAVIWKMPFLTPNTTIIKCLNWYTYYDSNGLNETTVGASHTSSLESNRVKLYGGTYGYYASNIEYTLITMA